MFSSVSSFTLLESLAVNILCLPMTHTPGLYKSVDLTEYNVLCGVEVLGRLLEYLSSLMLVSTEISTVPASMGHSGFTSAASRPCVNWESLAK